MRREADGPWSDSLPAAVAVALVVGTSEIVGDVIEQDVWEQLHERGLIATARDIAGEGYTFATADGIAWLTEVLSRKPISHLVTRP